MAAAIIEQRPPLWRRLLGQRLPEPKQYFASAYATSRLAKLEIIDRGPDRKPRVAVYCPHEAIRVERIEITEH